MKASEKLDKALEDIQNEVSKFRNDIEVFSITRKALYETAQILRDGRNAGTVELF